MKIVLTNDDGIDAPGLQSLYERLQGAGHIIVVAPNGPQSGVAHQVTTHTPLIVKGVEANRFSVSGTPADCVRIALKVLAPDADWVIAGINPGANLGSDIYNSGTVAAAREAAILGRRAIAISQYIARDAAVDWDITGHHAKPVLNMLFEQPLKNGTFWNVNLPHPLWFDSTPEYEFCGHDTNPHKYIYVGQGNTYSYKGSIHERPRTPGKDVDVCFGGKVAITRIAV